MRHVRWKRLDQLGLTPEPMYPELEAEAWDDEDVDEEYGGGRSFVAGQHQGPRIPKRGTPPVKSKPKRAWAAPGGALERVLMDALGLPASYRQVIADSLRAHVTGARIVDRRADAEWGDVCVEWLTGRD